MSIDVIERRRAVEERLTLARTVARTVQEATADIAAGSGRPIEDLDPDGSLRTALQALAGAAALRPHFDVLVALPDSPFALRVRHVDNDVDIEVLQRPDDEAAPAPEPAGRNGSDGSDSSPSHPDQTTQLDEAAQLDEVGQTGPGDPVEPDEVASDLAAMLWQSVGTGPS